MAASRGIGSVHIDVSADTTGFRQQVVRAAKLAGKQAQQAIDDELGDIGGQKLTRAVARIRRTIQKGLTGILIDIGIDERSINDDLKRVNAMLKAAELELRIDADVEAGDVADDLSELRAMLASVGNIQIKSDVDRETLARALSEISRLVESLDPEAKIKVNDDAWTFTIAKIKSDLESLSVEPELETTQFQQDVERLKRSLREFTVDMGVDTDEASNDIARFRSTLRDIELGLELDDDFARNQIRALRIAMSELKIDAELSQADLEKIRASLEAAVTGIEAGVDIDVPTSEIRETVAEINARLDAANITAPVKTEVDNASMAKTQATLGAGGISAGDLFSTNFIGRTQAIVAAVVTLGEPLAAALQGALAGSISILSSAVFAVGSAAAGAVPLLVGFGGAVAGVMLAIDGMGDAMSAAAEQDMEKFNEAIAELTPNAADFAQSIYDVVPAFNELRDSLQEELFAGLGDAFTSLANDTIPELTSGLGVLIGHVNDFGTDLFGIFQEIDFDALLSGLGPAVDAVLDGVLMLVDGFFEFVQLATPFATEIAHMFENWAKGITDFDGSTVTDFLRDGLDSLNVWMDLFSELGDMMGTILGAGREAGDGFITGITNALDTFNDFLATTEGENALANFFETGKEIIQSLEPILDAIIELFDELVDAGAVDRFAELAENVATLIGIFGALWSQIGEANVLNELMEIFIEIGKAVSPIAGPIAEFIGIIAKLKIGPWLELVEALALLAPIAGRILAVFEDLVGAGLETLGKILDAVARAVIKLWPAIEELVPVIIDLVDAFVDGLMPILDVVVDMIALLLPPIKQVLKAVTPLIPLLGELLAEAFEAVLAIIQPLLPVIVLLVEALADTLAPIFPVLVEAINEMAEALIPMVEQLGPVLGEAIIALLPLLPPLVDLFIAMFTVMEPLLPVITDLAVIFTTILVVALEKIVPKLVGLIETLTEFNEKLSDIVGFIADWVGKIIDWFQKLYDKLVGHSIIPDLINGVLDWFGKLWDLIELVADVFQGIYDAVVDFLGDVKTFIQNTLGTIKEAMRLAWDAIKIAAETAWNLIKDAVMRVVDGWVIILQTAWDTIKSAAQAAWDLIEGYIVDPIEAAFILVGSWIDDIVGLFDVFDRLSNTVKGMMNAVKDALVNPIRDAWYAIRDFINNIINKFNSIPTPDLTPGFDLPGPFGAAGGLFNRATPMIIGEAGREALIPLDRPLSQVDPSVRDMAATLRGQKPGGGMTNNWTIYEAGNAEVTAQKVINRLLVHAA